MPPLAATLALAAMFLFPNRRAHDHLTDHNWQLEIEGVTQGAFAEVSGLDSETEVVKYQDGNDLILRKRSRTKGEAVVMTAHAELNDPWPKEMLGRKGETFDANIRLVANAGFKTYAKGKGVCGWKLRKVVLTDVRVRVDKATGLREVKLVLQPKRMRSDCHKAATFKR